MEEKVHAIAAEEHFAIAEKCHAKLAKETGKERRTALMTVAAQNYFYASINFIEAILAKAKMHSFSHENRMRNILENKELFSKEDILLYEKVDRSIRNRVAYRGENGASYKAMRELAQLLAKNGR